MITFRREDDGMFTLIIGADKAWTGAEEQNGRILERIARQGYADGVRAEASARAALQRMIEDAKPVVGMNTRESEG